MTNLEEHTPGSSGVANNYLTQHFDNARTGWNPHETILTTANVPHLKLLFTHRVDAAVYAQPLYVQNVAIPGQNSHNIVFIATENDTVFAFDADSNRPALWQRRLVSPGESPVATTDIEQCTNIAPIIGITSTPVIDIETNTMYVVAKTKRVQGTQKTFHQYLHALDITTGSDRPGSPREIQTSVPGTGQMNDGHGNVLFLPQWQLNRPGLLLANGLVYVAFGAHCDLHLGEYHGWIVAYDAATLHHVATFNSTPDGSAAGIRQSGIGPATDPSGAIYCVTGNGTFDGNLPKGRDFGDAVLKLDAHLTHLDYFTPSNQAALSQHDIDFGSGGVLVLPDQAPDAKGPRQLLVTCGKDGRIFLLNRQNLGKFNGPNGPDHIVQSLPLQPGSKSTQPGIWGGPAYYSGPAGQFIYYCGNGGHLKAFKLQDGELSLSTVAGGKPNQSTDPFPSEGGVTPTVSSNQQITGTAVVWAITHSNPLRLQAYDATNLTVKLFDTEAGPWKDHGGGAFIEPTVINGKVYIGNIQELRVFGP
jgi:hypothetical protein